MPEKSDIYSLCILSKSRYEDVYNQLCNPYYLLVGGTSKRMRVCCIVFADEPLIVSLGMDAAAACVSPCVRWYFKDDATVTIDQYISFVYRPLPVAHKLVVQQLKLNDTHTFAADVDPLTKERLFAVQTELIVCPKDTLYCFASAASSMQPVPVIDPGTARAYNIVSIEYEGPGKETYSASLPSLVGDIGTQSHPGFIVNESTTVFAQLEGFQHDYINYPAIGYARSLLHCD